MGEYCSLVVHLLRGRELGARNALTGNVERCAKHKTLRTCGNMTDCNGFFDDRAYSYLVTCYDMIRGYLDRNYYRNYNDEEEREICGYGPVDGEYVIHSCHSYKFNIVKECEDIYIEVRGYLDGELYMTIDAKKNNS